MIEKIISKSNFLRKQTLKIQIVQIRFCKENHGVQLSLYILKLSIFSCPLFCNACSFSFISNFLSCFFAIFLLQISSAFTFTHFVKLVVFDAAATCEKNKLNTSLQTGLDLFNSSIVIHLRFRNTETVLVADLEADLEARSFIKLESYRQIPTLLGFCGGFYVSFLIEGCLISIR